jgi:hypothetical protein
MAKNTKQNQDKRPAPPKGMIDAADDLYLDMINSPPDPDEMVFRVNPDGSITKFPATELDPKDW